MQTIYDHSLNEAQAYWDDICVNHIVSFVVCLFEQKKNQELLGSRQHEPGTLDRFISGTDLTTTSTKYVEREKKSNKGK